MHGFLCDNGLNYMQANRLSTLWMSLKIQCSFEAQTKQMDMLIVRSLKIWPGTSVTKMFTAYVLFNCGSQTIEAVVFEIVMADGNKSHSEMGRIFKDKTLIKEIWSKLITEQLLRWMTKLTYSFLQEHYHHYYYFFIIILCIKRLFQAN